MTEEQKAKRTFLKKLSDEVCKNLSLDELKEINVNELLAKYYEELGHSSLKSFYEWKKVGYSIKKGEKALLLWGRPKKMKVKKEGAKNKEDEEKEAEFFPIAYVFSDLQVEVTD